MDILFENPYWWIVICGVAIEIVLILVFFATGRPGVLWAIGGVLVFFAAWIGVERMVVTERERVAMAVDEGIKALLTNDKQKIVSQCISPSATHVQSQVATGLSMATITYVEANGLDIKVDMKANPPRAVAKFTARIFFRPKSSDIVYDRWIGRMTVPFVKENGRWLVVDPVEGSPIN